MKLECRTRTAERNSFARTSHISSEEKTFAHCIANRIEVWKWVWKGRRNRLPHGKFSKRDPQNSRVLEVFQVLKSQNSLSFDLRGTRIVQCESFSRLIKRLGLLIFHSNEQGARLKRKLFRAQDLSWFERAIKPNALQRLWKTGVTRVRTNAEAARHPLTQIQSGTMPISKLLSRQ